MQYCFKSSITEENDVKVISIPFNVWEVCDSQGVLPVRVIIGEDSFSCDLLSKGKGFYNIPVPAEFVEKLGESEFETEFEILNMIPHLSGNSPYNASNPIRKIDSMKLVTQPNDGLCGQTCIAMLADVTLDEACEIMHCRDWQASMGKMVDTLNYLAIPHTSKIVYTQGELVTLPKCAIIMEKMGRYSHYLIYFDGTYYDPTMGIIDAFDMKNMVGYLEIITA